MFFLDLFLQLLFLVRREPPLHEEMHEPAVHTPLLGAFLRRKLEKQEFGRAVRPLGEMKIRRQVVVVLGPRSRSGSRLGIKRHGRVVLEHDVDLVLVIENHGPRGGGDEGAHGPQAERTCLEREKPVRRAQARDAPGMD